MTHTNSSGIKVDGSLVAVVAGLWLWFGVAMMVLTTFSNPGHRPQPSPQAQVERPVQAPIQLTADR